MKAAVITKPYHIEIQEVPDPGALKENEVLIKVSLTGICGSEVHAFKGTHPWRVPPVISGHELVGVVVGVGEKVKSVFQGSRVTVEPHVGCGDCNYCKNNLYNLCLNKRILGTPDWVGSFAEYIVVPESTVIPVPDNVSDELAALTEPLAVGMHAARKLEINPGDSVLVLGAGPIGLSICLAAKTMGAGKIIITDMFDHSLEVAKELGVDVALNVQKDDVENTVKGLTKGYGVDCVAIAVGNEKVLNQGLQLVKRAGKVVEVALFDGQPIVNIGTLQVGELNLRGCNMYTREDFEQVLAAIENNTIDPTPLVSHVMPIEQIRDGIEMVDKKLDNAVKVLLHF